MQERVKDGKRGMENELRTKPLEIRDEYERQLNELEAPFGLLLNT